MSFERKLMEAFKRDQAELECPPSLDERIMADYGRMAMDGRRNIHMKNKRGLSRVAIIAAIIAVLTGFGYAGTQLLFSDSLGKYSIRMQSNEALTISPEALDNARASLKAVQDELAPGTTAVVYLPEVFSEYRGAPLPIGVASPDWIAGALEWRSVLEEKGVTETLPDNLLGGAYTLKAGAEGSPFHVIMGLDAADSLEEMKDEHHQTGGSEPLWRLTEPSAAGPESYYTSVYKDVNDEALYYTWQIISDASIKTEALTSPSTVYEELDLDGHKAHYTKNDQSLFGESNVLQGIMWMEEKEGETVVHHVESDSASMTKERLVEAAAGLFLFH
ncbi:hypothetical protein [Paenibacillus agaridevorans]|uniref:hypothetical protein n=1 Tax=Paenibacillus agaridevorans TaxID=171404 RepID=UPI001BE453BC|nr:hypothetical protein [Paenibacillus agaridevorans]